MIEFSKKVLNAVGSNRYLFAKELKKIVMWCGNNDHQKSMLQEWCIQNYGYIYDDVIREIFVDANEYSLCYNS